MAEPTGNEAPVVPEAPATPVTTPTTPVEPVQPTPVEPVAEPVKEPVTPVEEPVAPEVIQTGIPFYDNAAAMVQQAGMDPVDILSRLKESDGEVSDELRAELTEKLGATNTFFLEQGLNTQVGVERKDKEAVVNSIGGQETWDSIVEWTQSDSSTLTEEQETAYNEMLAKGGESAKLAAAKIKEAYMADPNITLPAGTAMSGDSAVPPVNAMTPISRSEYTEKKKEAIRTNNAAEVKSLEARARYTMDKQPTIWRPPMGRY